MMSLITSICMGHQNYFLYVDMMDSLYYSFVSVYTFHLAL